MPFIVILKKIKIIVIINKFSFFFQKTSHSIVISMVICTKKSTVTALDEYIELIFDAFEK